MSTIYIADDEPVIIRGIKKMLTSLPLDIRIIGCSTDGETALSEILSLNPDIVISDIAMPKKTGLELLTAIADRQINTKVIFLSGYAEFTYVKEAISYGAVDYLLKPIEQDVLEKTLNKTISLLEDQKHLNFLHENPDELQKIFKKLNSGSYEEEALYENFKEQGLDLSEKSYACVQFYLPSSTRRRLQEDSYEKYSLMKFSVFNQISEYLELNKCGFPIKKEDHKYTLISILPEDDPYTQLKKHIESISSLLKNQFGILLIIGVGELFYDIKDWQLSYKTACLSTELYYFTDQKIIYSENIHRDFSNSFEEYDSACKTILYKILRLDTSVTEDFSNCLDLIENIHFGNRTAAVNRCISLIETLLHDISNMNLIPHPIIDTEQIINTLSCQETYKQLKIEFTSFFNNLLEELFCHSQSKETLEVMRIKEYIKEHCFEDLTLNKIASIACMNPSYFSAFFKKNTGQNFKSYLSSLRMQKALQLLLQTDMKIYEISNTVGYKSVRQFTDTFKQEYGVSPMDYKKHQPESGSESKPGDQGRNK